MKYNCESLKTETLSNAGRDQELKLLEPVHGFLNSGNYVFPKPMPMLWQLSYTNTPHKSGQRNWDQESIHANEVYAKLKPHADSIVQHTLHIRRHQAYL